MRRDLWNEKNLAIPANRRDEALSEYGKLHDGLSNMIEGGRLKKADIPDDYHWLVIQLVKLNAFWTGKGVKYGKQSAAHGARNAGGVRCRRAGRADL